MILINGSHGEGGGQILRTSLTLSLLTGQPFRIDRIRSGRAKPGLLRQHFTALQAAAAICGGKVSDGVKLGSRTAEFYPGTVRAGTYEFAVGTAGSAMLVLQTILLPLLFAGAPSRIIITGGTHNPAAPPFDFVEKTYLPVLARMGAHIDLQLIRHGFMPAGGGRILADIQPLEALTPVSMTQRADKAQIHAEALFANVPFDIAERELALVSNRFKLAETHCKPRQVKSPGPGNAIVMTVSTSGHTEVFTGFGARGIPAEDVVDGLAGEVEAYLGSTAAVGPHLADQLMLPLAIAGGGVFTTTKVTGHARTNADTIARFMPVETTFEENGDAGHVVVRMVRRNPEETD